MDPAKAVTLTLLLALAGCVTSPRTGRVPDWSFEDPNISPPSRPVPSPLSSATNSLASKSPASIKRSLPQADEFQETWIPLNRWSRVKGLELPSRFSLNGLPAYAIHSGQGRFALQPGSPLAEWEGVQIQLGFPPQLIDNQPYLHAVDVRKNLAPLLAGGISAWQKPSPVIVLDPGHGGADSGTRSLTTGRLEKEFTLDWALRLRSILLENGWRVHLTREVDTDLSLTNRVAMAEELHADLFLSLHFNSTANGQEQSGLETYCLTPVGLPSNLTRGYEDAINQAFPNNVFDTENILLATRLHRALLGGIDGLRDRGIRRARFLGVLRGQRRPAVLLEAGYLSNPAEARLVADPEYRQQLAEAVARGLIGRMNIAGLRSAPPAGGTNGSTASPGILAPSR